MFGRRTRVTTTTTARPRRGGLFHRTRPARTHHTTTTGRHHHHHTTHAAPVVHHKRHATMGDKISGAFLRLKGSLTRRPGQKAAGTRRMHGTDGRGSHRRRYW
ncbi:uncharacterized protein E0L32_006240 [Thyridium curvatum]|uniref:Uncharacterized protein n=1 Tax=Thyridium curvatum TaxID=1093900 RepID=A0A507B0L2_9PEZI|nr:uncharacterized protein E0L32_006240 [Thyridium curvatum]TPX13267.1 hypothetical protein E0L32_006240 [Thyridium curvatum]